MPVPTETFRRIRRINLICAVTAAFLFVITFWLIMDEWCRPWRAYQRDGRQWRAVITEDVLEQTDSVKLRMDLAKTEEEIRRVRDSFPNKPLMELERELAAADEERIKKDLALARLRSEIVLIEQQIERAKLEFGDEGQKTKALVEKLKNIRTEQEAKLGELSKLAADVRKLTDEIAALKKAEDDQKRDLENLARERRTLVDRLAKLESSGVAIVDEKASNAPRLDWFSPSEKIEQVIVPGVRTDLNFLTVNTADACKTCHVNIDRPEFAEGDLVKFLQRQIARSQHQDINTIDDAVVAVDFWENAIAKLIANGRDASVVSQLANLRRETLERQRAIHTNHIDLIETEIAETDAAKRKTVLSNSDLAEELKAAKKLRDELLEARVGKTDPEIARALAVELERLAQTSGTALMSRHQWYEQRLLYADDLQTLIKQQVGEKEFGLLMNHFRHTLIDQFNALRKARGADTVSNSPVMMAHPRLDLYLTDGESPHPLKSMGCSVCHEGSGQDTSFFHTAHTPRNIWVDADTGATISDFLLTIDPQDRGSESQLRAKVRELKNAPAPAPKKDALVSATAGTGSITLASSPTGATPQAADKKDHDHHHVAISGQDVNLLTPGNPAPFAPQEQDHAQARIYIDPASNTPRVAIRQATHWKKKYNWHSVHLVDWEKPMHAMEFVQSSCTKCHTGHFDLKQEAPKIFHGRKLFAQVGCANCHQVDQIADHKDLKKVGPSLAHVKEKLSPSMLATWIWSPKAFRPTSRMPHFFMLENNSSPVDILRTRTEVAALTHYLLNAPPASLEKIALLMQEDGKLVAERAKESTANSRKFEIDKRRTAIAAEVSALKNSGIERYQPELPPTQAKVKTLTDEKTRIEAILKDAATKAEDKPVLQQRLAAIDGEVKAVKEKPLIGDVKRGRELFMGVPGATLADGGIGCAACHTNLNETGQQWITADLMKRAGLTAEKALAQYNQLSYNQKHTYVLQYTPEKLNRGGPELSGVGTKLKAGRDAEHAAAWIYDWVRNPSHYSSYTIMPSFRLSEQEALDLTAYLLAQERPGDSEGSTYAPVDFIAEIKGELNTQMLDALTTKLSGDEMQTVEAKLMFVGKKLVMHYNCQACHQINGYEETASSAPQLNDWGLKDPHKLDYGYLEQAEERRRREPATVWKAAHEGLGSDAARITAHPRATEAKPHPALSARKVAWEHIHGDRREWATYKLHNTRIYDRGRYVLSEAVETLDLQALDAESLSMKQAMARGVDHAYDKLKMPKFFLTDEDAQAIITFVTSIRKSLVESALQKVATDAGQLAITGRQIAEKYNCYGCHNIEANKVAIHSLYDVLDDRGHFNGNFERLGNAPPRLIGQGAKTQPDWVVQYLDSVHPLRPWLKVRMPSFHFDGHDATGIAEYFAGATDQDARQIAKILAPIDSQLQKNDARKKDLDIEAARITERLAASEKATDSRQKLSKNRIEVLANRLEQIAWHKGLLDRWSEQPALARATEKLRQFSLRNDLVQPRLFDPRLTTPEDLVSTMEGVLASARFLEKTYQIQYPHSPPRFPDISAERFARGEALFNQVLCAKCHALGDEAKLLAIWKLDNPNAGAPPAVTDPSSPVPATPPAFEGPVWSAPNLRHAVHRIQPRWADLWLQRSMLILPGTKMPNQWAGPSPLDSFFFQFPDEAKIEAHKKFYYTGPEQRQLILDYIYAAGMRNHTPDAWKLEGKPEPRFEFSEVFPPKADGFKRPELDDGSSTATVPEVAGSAVATAAKAKSTIVLHDGDAAYEGEAVHGHKTRVVGRIKFDGARPRRGLIRMASDPFCEKAHREDVFDEALIVNEDGTLQNAFVQIKSVPGSHAPSTTPVVLDQKGCVYHPHVAGVMVGQPLIALNSDSTLHNVHVMAKKNPQVNVGQSQKGMKEVIVFKNAEENVVVRCDVHGWMNARVHVVPHPFFFVSDVEGRYEIRGLPPGRYTLEVLHELSRITRQSVEIEVKADTSTRLDVTMK